MVTEELRDHTADFDDFWRPIRNYLYWEPHCFNIPICWSLRAIFDSIDGVDQTTDKLQSLVKDMDQLDVILPQLIAELPQMIASMQSLRTMLLTMDSTMSGIFAQMDETSQDATVMGRAFDAAKNDDSFYLPPEVFENPDFQRAMNSFRLGREGGSIHHFA